MIMRIRNKQKNKRGFTLTEIAIVLGIVGLILGAIWVAAAAVYNNLRVSKATTDLITIVQNVRSMYATSSTVDTNADMTYAAPGAAQKVLTYPDANIFPEDMISGTTAAPVVSNPWGSGVDIESAYAVTKGTEDSFSVNFDGVPAAACINFLTSNTGQGRDPGLLTVNTAAAGTDAFLTAGNGGAGSAVPLLASTAATLCGVKNASWNVGFAFQLKG